MADGIHDLVYSDATDKKAIAERFPAAVIEDASDMIHGDRFSVTLADGRNDYLRFLMETGIADLSFIAQLMLRLEPEKLLALRPTPAGRVSPNGESNG